MNMTWRQTNKSILFLAGAFTFAFLLAEGIHEMGHYLAHRFYGNEIHIHLDPFGGSRMVGSTALPENEMIITSIAGPALNLVLAMICLLSLWKIRKPALLPLLLWGPTAMIQEGVNLSLGLLSPNSDAQWITHSGIPRSLLVIFGGGLLIAGLPRIAAMLPLAGINHEYPFGRTILIVAAGMCSLMLIRLMGVIFTNPDALVENLVPLGFSGIFALVVAALQRPLAPKQTPYLLNWNMVGNSLALGAGMFICQLFLFS